MSERLRQGLPQRNKREKKLQTPEGEGPSREGRTLADSQPQGGNSKRTGSPRVPGEPTGRGGSHTRRRRLQAQKAICRQGTKPVRRTWRQTHGQGSTKERTKKPPKTHSPREVHPERGHKRLQGAKLSNRPRYQPQPAEKRVGYERPPQTSSKGGEATLNPNKGP